jgi:hypothetical protein
MIIAGILLVSCVSEDPAPIIAAVDYQLYCDRGNGCNGLVSKSPHVVERAIDGQGGFSVSCSKGDKLADISLDFAGADYGFSLDSSTSECTIRVVEESNVYLKSCLVSGKGNADCGQTAAEEFEENSGDMAEMPCQVSVSTDGSTVSGTLCCRNIPEDLKQALGNEYSLVLSQDKSKPASFEFKHCK